ncbi:zinc-ribbon domain-containing protein [Yoonia sp. F2084L]|uniref:zinc-ribbon domain-containing protein n=1 Tax=Yoonia sp. F2084L TaxID=2926419 RepID=UPI001FF618D0|nr:zinc-ribbon domain-containing protein [Yoonia sp. F2084L]MCK0095028.1 zinc-ribbon domain-containing protein [Yoonia sp. F2084L]
MRLICPNCEAQYEVSDDAIPPGGRDVQCSNCQQSWFQTEKPTVPGRETSKLVTPKLPDAVKETKPKSDPLSEDESADTPPEPKRKELDSTVANILREEAKRAGAFPGPKTPKPPATEAAKRAETVDTKETLQRIAKMTHEEGGIPAGQGAAAAAAASAANVRSVPDINEINAALRARAEASDTSGLTEKEKREAVERGGFRRGFFFILILFALLILPYVFADQITENLPQTRGFMATYVTTIDQLRVQLNTLISGLTSG